MIKMIALQLELCALVISLDMTLVDISDTQQKNSCGFSDKPSQTMLIYRLTNISI